MSEVKFKYKKIDFSALINNPSATKHSPHLMFIILNFIAIFSLNIV